MDLKVSLIEIFFLLALKNRGEATVEDLVSDISFEGEIFLSRKKILRVGQKLKVSGKIAAKYEDNNRVVYVLTRQGEKVISAIEQYFILLARW